jgi:hypothetical protein
MLARPFGLEVQRLLDGLRQARIRAAFLIPGEPATWVAISSNYWISVTSKDFKAIREGGKSKRPGMFVTSLMKHANEYVGECIAESRTKDDDQRDKWLISTFIQAFEQADSEFEVHLIRDDDWERFLEKTHEEAVESGSLVSSKRSGRIEKDWKVVYRVLVARLFAEGLQPNEIKDIKKMASWAVKEALVLEEGKIDPPKQGSIEKEIQSLNLMIERLKR